MPLPTPNLDDLRFQQDLVDEARRRIVQYCPEWTDYNLSDPGIALIELFSWMSEVMIYRLNRVPDKNYVKFMELLGITLQPASAARTELTFRLSVPFPISEEDDTIAQVPQHTEVATRPVENEDEVIFTTDEQLTIYPPKITDLRRQVDFARNYHRRLAVQDCRVFRDQFPEQGDTFYIGFDPERTIAGYILRLSFATIPTQATGIRRDDPPLVWECSLGGDRWFELTPSRRRGERDTTGGLNNPQGHIFFYVPTSAGPDTIEGITAFWLRCRFHQRRPAQGTYTRSPRLKGLQAHVLGATVDATHSVLLTDEPLGTTTGEPGQTFRLANVPMLAPDKNEFLEIEERIHGELVFVPWQRVDDFSRSSRYDRHYTLDTSTGEIALGPNMRQRDGQIVQFGRVPEANRLVRFAQYRAGGGVQGNIPIGRLNVLLSTIPYIDSATNLVRAAGGTDPETLEEAKMRVPQELRTQQRAVTASDYRELALKSSRSVARVQVLTPQQGQPSPPPGTIEILVVPECRDALAVGDLTRLHLTRPLQRQISAFLDEYRLLTTNLLVREPAYIGVRVFADILIEDHMPADSVRGRVIAALRSFLSPLPLAGMTDFIEEVVGTRWEGWPFGRDLYESEILSVVQKVPGVRHVHQVTVEQRAVQPQRESRPSDDLPPEEEIQDSDRGLERPRPVRQMLSIPSDALLCSLDHQITIVNHTGDHTGADGRSSGSNSSRTVPVRNARGLLPYGSAQTSSDDAPAGTLGNRHPGRRLPGNGRPE